MSESKNQGPQPTGAYERPIARRLDFYLTGDIKEAKEYNDWFQMLRMAQPHDSVNFHINSNGGDIFTAIQMMKTMTESHATITASSEGMCMSAATFIFLTADICEIADHSHFMFHNYSTGNWGKGHEILANALADDRWARHLLRKVYDGFFTPTEIEKIIEGKDYWLGPEDVHKRLQKRNKMKKKQRMK